jgi:hypothetical protein
MKKTTLPLSLMLLAVILSAGVGCAKKPDDAKISADTQAKFSQDSGLSSKQLTVQASNGVVTLGGVVDNEAQRDAASRQAASVPGVTQVVNNLEIGNAASVKAKAKTTQTPVSETKPARNTPVADRVKPAAGRKSRKSHHTENAATAEATPPASNDTMAKNDATPPPPVTSAAAPAVPDAPPPPKPKKMIIDQGTQLTVRLVDAIDSEKNQTGDTFHATLNVPLSSDGEDVVPAGSDLTGHLVDVKSAGKFKGQSQVVLQLDSITAGGKTYNIQTDQYKKDASSRGKNTAEKVGGGAVIGGIIGALAGGGKGAAIGAAAGAGVGGGVQAATKAQQIKLPSETVLNFTLQAPITVIQAPNPNADRPKLGDSQ